MMDLHSKKPVIRHISFGNGNKTMVVVPGLTIGHVTDNPDVIKNIFSAFTEEYTVYLFDVRDDVPENYTLYDMGEDLSCAIRDLGLKRVYLYGCSMGGMECIYVAGKYPELVEKMAIVSSSCKANATSQSVIGKWISLAKEGKRRELTESMGKLIYSEAFFEANREMFISMADGLTQKVLTDFVNTAGAVLDMDLTKEAAAVKCPVLVIGSEGDRVLSPEASSQIAEITGGRLFLYGREFPHAVYDENPDCREKVKKFYLNSTVLMLSPQN